MKGEEGTAVTPLLFPATLWAEYLAGAGVAWFHLSHVWNRWTYRASER